LIHIDRERVVADQLSQIAQIGPVAFLPETDLQLEGAMAALHRLLRSRDAAVGIDAAGIGAHAA
jgi:hypothetical protein